MASNGGPQLAQEVVDLRWVQASEPGHWPESKRSAGITGAGEVFVAAALVSDDVLFVGTIALTDGARAIIDKDCLYVEGDWARARAPAERRANIDVVIAGVREFAGWKPS